MGISPDAIWGHLAELGVDKDDMGLSILDAPTTTEADAERFFVHGTSEAGALAKVARFKAGWLILKGKKIDAPAEGEKRPSLRKVADFSDEALLKEYGPDADTRVVDELASRSKGNNVIVFNDDGTTVNVEVSLTLLKLSRRQKPPRTYLVNGKLATVHAVGEFPSSFAEECPIHGNVILADGFCEQCQNSWKGVPEEDRVIVRVASGYLGQQTLTYIAQLISWVRSKGAKYLLDETPVIGARYDELKKDDSLPKLRRKMSRTKNGDPFFVEHKTY
jgi:hypothetical protein